MTESLSSEQPSLAIERASVLPDGAHQRKPSWLDGFRRITTSGQFIPEIDGLRFIAIAAVILHHVAHFVTDSRGQTEGSISPAQHGVELFFVISGFILAVPFARQYLDAGKNVSLKYYFVRRLTRLEPPYLLSLVLLTVMKILLRGEHFSVVGWNLLFSIFYVHGILLGLGSYINGVAWSLEIEVQFYLLMPLLAMLFLIPGRWLRRGVMLAIAAAFMSIQPVYIRGLLPSQYVPGGPYYLERHIIDYIQYFLMGLLLADIYVVEWRSAPPPLFSRPGFAWGDLVWLVGWPAMAWLVWHGGRTMRWSFPPLIFVIYLALFYSVWARRLMRIEILTVIGGMCYSIYLVHNSVIQIAGPHVARFLPAGYFSATVVLGVIMLPLILLVCGMYFRLIEKPCMNPDWPRQIIRWFMGKLFVEDPPAPAERS
jgi:peptidoglycan/LPS O-acetylase OafA/YrhL